MSRRNPSSRSASFPKGRGGVKHSFFLLMFDLQKRPLEVKSPFETLAKDLHQVLRPNRIGTWDTSDTAKRRVKHDPFHHFLSRFFSVDEEF